MTNRELLNAAKEVLGPVDRQRQYVLRVELTPVPCPACLTPLDALKAAGINIDSFRFGQEKGEFRCPNCAAELEQIVPMFATGPGWFCQIKHNWLANRLHRAKLYDQEHPEVKP